MKSRLAIAVRDRMQSFCTALLFLPFFFSGAQAQSAPVFRDPTADQGASLEALGAYRTTAGTSVLVFTLFAERNSAQLDHQAVLKLVNLANHAAIVAVSDETSKGVFLDVLPGRYALEVPGKSGHIASFQHVHELAVARAKLKPFEFYCWRHTFGTRAAMAGMDKFSLARLMGHSSPSVAEKYYIHTVPEHVAAGFSKFVLVPVHQPADWADELTEAAAEVLPLQGSR